MTSDYFENKYHAQNVQADVQKMEKMEELLASPGCQAYMQRRKELTEYLVQQNPDALSDGYDNNRLIKILNSTSGDNPYCHE